MRSVVLKGPRITLRPLGEFDLPMTFQWRNANPEAFFSGAVTWKQHLDWADSMRRRDDLYVWIIETDCRIGQISLYDIEGDKAELGRMVIAPEHRRRGYAEEAVRTVLDFAHDGLKLSRVWLDVVVSNEAASGLYVKCGFRAEAVRMAHSG